MKERPGGTPSRSYYCSTDGWGAGQPGVYMRLSGRAIYRARMLKGPVHSQHMLLVCAT
jgi:hypothetical protein